MLSPVTRVKKKRNSKLAIEFRPVVFWYLHNVGRSQRVTCCRKRRASTTLAITIVAHTGALSRMPLRLHQVIQFSGYSVSIKAHQKPWRPFADPHPIVSQKVTKTMMPTTLRMMTKNTTKLVSPKRKRRTVSNVSRIFSYRFDLANRLRPRPISGSPQEETENSQCSHATCSRRSQRRGGG